MARALQLTLALVMIVPLAQSCADSFETYDYRVVQTYPHDANAYTQGLFIRDGQLYESTGQYGTSSIRKVSLETGKVEMQYDLANRYFGEGIVDWQDQLIALTWRSGTGFIFGLDDFKQRGMFSYTGEGWGLTRNDTHIIMSDGTENIRFLDPDTFEVEKSVAVTMHGKPQANINELEWIEGVLYANVWQTDWLLQIDPATGVVTGLADLGGLLPNSERLPGHTDVLNGIAWDAEARRLFVTGKHWPKLFEIELLEVVAGN